MLKTTPKLTPPPGPPDEATRQILDAVRPLIDTPGRGTADIAIEVMNAMIEYCLIVETPTPATR